MAALKSKAETGLVFEAYDLTDEFGIDDPDHPGRWGALFREANRLGVIEPAGYCVARRPTRAGGLTRLWRGRTGSD
ncbi:hypothetical protein RhoFasB10_00506 [Rhodococcus sp. B10]|nr:hypothetical protein [Rhodococcus sp. B10]